MTIKTTNHRELAEKMRAARQSASHPLMSHAEFLAQTPSELRVKKTAKKSQRANSKKS